MVQRPSKFTIDRPENIGLMAAYFPVNDPLVPLDRLEAFAAARVDVIELGLRTTDAYADGEVVTASMKRSNGVGTISEAKGAIAAIHGFEYDAMGMIFGYVEPKLAPDDTVWANVDGLLALGKPGPELEKLNTAAAARGTRITRYVPYDLPVASVDAACTATGFAFLHYTAGETGIRSELDTHLSARVAHLRRSGVTAPIFAGIGISSLEQADHAMQAGVDGIVVGSRTIQTAVEGYAALEDYLCELREVLNGR